jgi:hypothetical protein
LASKKPVLSQPSITDLWLSWRITRFLPSLSSVACAEAAILRKPAW